jgi:hypothetical protein
MIAKPKIPINYPNSNGLSPTFSHKSILGSILYQDNIMTVIFMRLMWVMRDGNKYDK